MLGPSILTAYTETMLTYVPLIVVYIVIEAHHRARSHDAFTIWTLFDIICDLHPKLMSATEHPEERRDSALDLACSVPASRVPPRAAGTL